MTGLDKNIASHLMEWFEEGGRTFPWRTTDSQYKIFVAELLLRRTRAETVADYFPDLMHLAESFEELQNLNRRELRRVLKPLGLIRRADWLVENAKLILEQHNDRVPQDPESLLKMKGVGKYTKDALLCFVHDKHRMPVDANIRRIGKRLSGRALSDEDIKGMLREMAPHDNFKKFVFALLDLGSEICHEENPDCGGCPLASFCEAEGRQLQEQTD